MRFVPLLAVFGIAISSIAAEVEPGATKTRLGGVWRVVKTEIDPTRAAKHMLQPEFAMFARSRGMMTDTEGAFDFSFRYQITQGRKGPWIDLYLPGDRTTVMEGIYVIEGDLLQLCFAIDGSSRPSDLSAAGSPGYVGMTLKRLSSDR